MYVSRAWIVSVCVRAHECDDCVCVWWGAPPPRGRAAQATGTRHKVEIMDDDDD
jgi:hypothetical protein